MGEMTSGWVSFSSQSTVSRRQEESGMGGARLGENGVNNDGEREGEDSSEGGGVMEGGQTVTGANLHRGDFKNTRKSEHTIHK